MANVFAGFRVFVFKRFNHAKTIEPIWGIMSSFQVVSMEPMVTVPYGRPGAGGYREHDILVVNEDGTVDNITKFPLGPAHNIIPV